MVVQKRTGRSLTFNREFKTKEEVTDFINSNRRIRVIGTTEANGTFTLFYAFSWRKGR